MVYSMERTIGTWNNAGYTRKTTKSGLQNRHKSTSKVKTQAHTYWHTHIHTHAVTRTNTRTQMNFKEEETSTNAHTQTQMHAHTHTQTHKHAHTSPNTHTHTSTQEKYTQRPAHTQASTHTHKQSHIQASTHTHKQSLNQSSSLPEYWTGRKQKALMNPGVVDFQMVFIRMYLTPPWRQMSAARTIRKEPTMAHVNTFSCKRQKHHRQYNQLAPTFVLEVPKLLYK